MLSSRIRAGSITSISTPSLASSEARLANSSGKSTFGGSLIRSRAMTTPCARLSAPSPSRDAAAASPTSSVRWVADLSSASGFFLVL